MASTSEPYNKPIRAQVVALSSMKDFISSSGEPRSFLQLKLATEGRALKAFHYEPQKIQTIKEGNHAIIRNYRTPQDQNITLNAIPTLYKCASFIIPSTVIETAKALIHPTEAELVTVLQATTSPVKTMVSLKGFITQVWYLH